MRWKRLVTIGVFLIIALMATGYVILANYDYNKLTPQVARIVKEVTGRELNLGGKIDLAIGFSPTLTISDVTFANASWGSEPQMVKIKQVQVQVAILPLLFKGLELKHIGFVGVDVFLETDKTGRGNWDFNIVESSGGITGAFTLNKIDIDKIRIEKLNLTFRDGEREQEKRLTLASLEVAQKGAVDSLALELKADYNGQQLALAGKIGLIQLLLAHDHFPFELAGKFSNTTVKIAGTINDFLNLQGIDLQASVAGTNLAELELGFGPKLPQTNVFDLLGHLKGSKEALALEDLIGKLSASAVDLAISGSCSNVIAFSGMDLHLKGSGQNLAEIGLIIGEKLPATDEFSVVGRLTGSLKTLTMSEASGSAKRDSLNLTLNGKIENLIDLSGLDLQVKGSGKSLTEVGSIIGQKLPATDEFAIQGRLTTGSNNALSLQEARGSANKDGMSVTLNGEITDVLALRDINIRLKASGNELAEIGTLVGSELPNIGPFDVRGHLIGSNKLLQLREFSAIVDKSDFKGLAKIEFSTRPKITMQLESSVIDLTPLLSMAEKDKQELGEEKKRAGRLFPDDPLPFDALQKVDADFNVKARNIRMKDAQLEFGHLNLTLADSNLRIDNLEATYKKTKITGNLHIDPGSPPRVATNFLVQNFNLGEFLKETGKSDQVRGIVDIAAHGKSSGVSVSSLMTNLNGSFGAVMGPGYLTKYLDLLSIDLADKVIPFWGHHKKADEVNCAAVQFDIKNGDAVSKAFVNSQIGILSVKGDTNLGTEQVNFSLNPQPKDFSLVNLSTKMRVTGTLMNPKVSPDTRSLSKRAAKEVLGFLTLGPLGLLTPFVHLGAHEKHPCDIQGIAQLKQKIPTNK